MARIRAKSRSDLATGSSVVIAIRPEHVSLDRQPPGDRAPNRWGGKVLARAFLGESVDHVVGVGKLEIRSRSNSTISIPPETEVTVNFPEEMCSLILADS